MIIYEFHQAKLSQRFPMESLEFLRLVTPGISFLAYGHELMECVDAIRQERPDLVTDQRFQDLLTNARQRGGG